MNLSAKDLLSFFKPVTIQRGRSYFQQAKVLESEEHQNGHYVTATVRGTGGKIYVSRIQLTFRKNKVIDIQGNCSCPVGQNCKHNVAALLNQIDRRPPQQEDMFGLPSDKWLYQLKSVQHTSESRPASNEFILYLLDMLQTETGSRLTVNLVHTRVLKNGRFSEALPYVDSASSKARFLREDDQQPMLLLKTQKPSDDFADAMLTGELGAKTLTALIATGRCHWHSEEYPALKPAKKISSRLSWKMKNDASQKIFADALEEDSLLLPLSPPYYVIPDSGDCGELDSGLSDALSAELVSRSVIGWDAVENYSVYLKDKFKDENFSLPVKPDVIENQNVDPVPCLTLLTDSSKDTHVYIEDVEPMVYAELNFDYGGVKVHPRDAHPQFIKKTSAAFEIIHRNLAKERQAINRLSDIGLYEADFFYDGDDGMHLEAEQGLNSWIDLMLRHRYKLEAEGWVIKITESFAYQIDEADEWYADVSQDSNEWFKLELGVDIDGVNINLLPFLVNYLGSMKGPHGASQLKKLPDDHPLLLEQANGRLLHVPLGKVRHIIDTLIELYDPDVLDAEGKLELSRYQGNQLVALDKDNTRLTWAGSDTLREFGIRLQDFKGIQDIIPPASLKTELRDYQKEGLNWLQFLRKFDLGGILADDMGLGKTVQTLAHLLTEKENNRATNPSLVVAPTSLMINWRREAERFAPSLKVLVLQGVERKNKFHLIEDSDLVLTTYPLLSRDTAVLMQQQWHIAILDEAQHIKNPKSKAAQTARQLNTAYRLCLTGTPMENHLGELWSQFHFLMPGLLSNEKRFRRVFRNPIEKHKDADRSLQLRKRIAPFMLRRNKSEVAQELPPKTEILSEVELEGEQRDLYETIRVSMHNKVKQAIYSTGIARSQIIILDALLKLRQVCCHPQLLKLPSAKKVTSSAKLNQLMEMLPEMVEEGRRILLFSQFTSMLAIIEQEMSKIKIPYVKLTGQTRDRETPIDQFQSGQVPVFLISLKAGGSGLNLTAADTVIHYDPWWNPAAENQATDRAHRIGQDKPVFVYKMITEGTVEEKIVEMQARKQALADSLFSEHKQGSGLTAEDLNALFEPLT